MNSAQAEAWRRQQLGKSRFELLVERVLAISVIETTLWAAYSLLSKSRQERFMCWLDE